MIAIAQVYPLIHRSNLASQHSHIAMATKLCIGYEGTANAATDKVIFTGRDAGGFKIRQISSPSRQSLE